MRISFFFALSQTSYYTASPQWPEDFEGGPVGKPNTTISVLKSIIDVLNNDYMGEQGEVNNCQDCQGKGAYHVNPSDRLVGSIQCWRNMCVLRRKFEKSLW